MVGLAEHSSDAELCGPARDVRKHYALQVDRRRHCNEPEVKGQQIFSDHQH